MHVDTMKTFKIAASFAAIIIASGIVGINTGNYLANRKIENDAQTFSRKVNNIIEDNSVPYIFGTEKNIKTTRVYDLKNGVVIQTNNSLVLHINELSSEENKKLYLDGICAISDRKTGKLIWLATTLTNKDTNEEGIDKVVEDRQTLKQRQKEYNKVLEQICTSYTDYNLK